VPVPLNQSLSDPNLSSAPASYLPKANCPSPQLGDIEGRKKDATWSSALQLYKNHKWSETVSNELRNALCSIYKEIYGHALSVDALEKITNPTQFTKV
jgi:hypothetical protein